MIDCNDWLQHSLMSFAIKWGVQNWVISLEIRPFAALYAPPPIHKKCFIGLRSRASISVVAEGGILMPTAFALLSMYCISLKKNYGRWGITLPGVWFQGTLPKIVTSYLLFIPVCNGMTNWADIILNIIWRSCSLDQHMLLQYIHNNNKFYNSKERVD